MKRSNSGAWTSLSTRWKNTSSLHQVQEWPWNLSTSGGDGRRTRNKFAWSSLCTIPSTWWMMTPIVMVGCKMSGSTTTNTTWSWSPFQTPTWRRTRHNTSVFARERVLQERPLNTARTTHNNLSLRTKKITNQKDIHNTSMEGTGDENTGKDEGSEWAPRWSEAVKEWMKRANEGSRGAGATMILYSSACHQLLRASDPKEALVLGKLHMGNC